jgi:serine/threonine protein kinase
MHRQAFEREADIIASLAHPHIIRLLDYDVAEGVPFLVTEYAPNGSLRQRHRGGQRVLLLTVVSYVQQIASALDIRRIIFRARRSLSSHRTPEPADTASSSYRWR